MHNLWLSSAFLFAIRLLWCHYLEYDGFKTHQKDTFWDVSVQTQLTELTSLASPESKDMVCCRFKPFHYSLLYHIFHFIIATVICDA